MPYERGVSRNDEGQRWVPLVQEWTDSGWTAERIGERLGRSTRWVYRLRARHGIDTAVRGRPPRCVPYDLEDTDEL
jgi:hypothetical protein